MPTAARRGKCAPSFLGRRTHSVLARAASVSPPNGLEGATARRGRHCLCWHLRSPSRRELCPSNQHADAQHTRGGTRTRNLLLRREAPYPLGHTSSCCNMQDSHYHARQRRPALDCWCSSARQGAMQNGAPSATTRCFATGILSLAAVGSETHCPHYRENYFFAGPPARGEGAKNQ
jgi:hypothetical protein